MPPTEQPQQYQDNAKQQKKRTNKSTIYFIIMGLLLLLSAIMTFFYFREKAQPSLVQESTINTNQTEDTTIATTNLSIPEYYKPIEKDGVIIHYPNDWVDPIIESSPAQDYVASIKYLPTLKYSYETKSQDGDGKWVCAEALDGVCDEGVVYTTDIARKDREIGSAGYNHITVFDFTIGDANWISHKYLIHHNDKMIALTLPTICYESNPQDNNCSDNEIIYSDKTDIIIDDIIAYIEFDE